VVCVFFRQEVGQGLGLQKLHRAHAAQQQRPGRRGAAGRLAHQQHLPQPVFQRLDAWDTAEGVTHSRRAAASKLPSSSTAAKAASWGWSKSMGVFL